MSNFLACNILIVVKNEEFNAVSKFLTILNCTDPNHEMVVKARKNVENIKVA